MELITGGRSLFFELGETRRIVSEREIDHMCGFARDYFDEILFLLPRSFSKTLEE